MIDKAEISQGPLCSRRRGLAILLGLASAPWIRAAESSGVVRVGFLRSYEPFSLSDAQGQIRGFDVEVSARLCEVLGLRLEPVGDGLSGLTRRLNSGEIAWLGNQLLMTTDNRRRMDFVRPAYASIQLCAVQHEDDDRDFLSLEDLQGKRLGVLARTGIEEQARGALGRAVQPYEHIAQALQDLANQKLDLVLEENLIADYYIDKHKLPLRVAAPFTSPIAVGLGIRKGDRPTGEMLARAVRQILQDGSLARISKNWFGYDVSRSRISHSAKH